LIPDVDPASYLLNSEEDTDDVRALDFSMAAGDFVGIYGNPRETGQWDSVVCCFFLDAAPSIVEYIQVIYKMLKDDGILLNLGPLLYHWSGPAMRPDDRTVEEYHSRFSYLDKRYMTSVDLCWEDVREILVNVGFEILEEKVGARALYTADRRSMMNMAYRCIHFVARKRGPIAEAATSKSGSEPKSS
jgi:carnosine N-methyltransferase